MPIIEQAGLEPTPIPGLLHSTWAGAADGLQQLSVWRQTLAPGTATPPHRHTCDEVVLCVAGSGELHEDGQPPRRFGSEHTVLLPRGGLHQIVACGPLPLELIGVFAATPVPAELPDGSALDLPWRT